MPWNYMRDHVNLRAWLSLRRRQEYNEEKSDGQTINFLISSFPAAARTVLVLSNVTSAGFAPSWQMTSPKPNQVQSAARDEQRRKNCERRSGGQWKQIRRNSKPAKLMDDAESLILIGFQRLYINSLFCHGTHLFKLTGSDGIYLG